MMLFNKPKRVRSDVFFLGKDLTMDNPKKCDITVSVTLIQGIKTQRWLYDMICVQC